MELVKFVLTATRRLVHILNCQPDEKYKVLENESISKNQSRFGMTPTGLKGLQAFLNKLARVSN